MEDKEKQIEEMAWVIQEDCNNGSCNNTCEFYSDKSFKKVFDKRLGCENIAKAKTIYDLGYRKLPEDSVVLSKEEYERLKGERKLCHNCGTYFQSAWIECPKCGTKPNDYERGSKETAEKFAKEMLSWLEKDDIDGRNCVIEVAKQFGVEIKE